MNLQTEKNTIIEQFKKVNDVNLINAIKNLLDFHFKEGSADPEIDEAHQKLVLERFEKIRKNPERLIDWDLAKNSLVNDGKIQN